MGFSLQELATASGLSHYTDPGPFNSTEGVLLGFKRKLLFMTGVNGADGRIFVVARFKGAIDREAMLNALKADRAMKKLYTIADIKLQGPEAVVWTFGKPMKFNAAVMAEAIDSMASVLSIYAQGLDPSRCEGERCNQPITGLTLANGIPNLMCEACKGKVAAEQEEQRKQYERRSPNYGVAFLYGLGAAIVTGLSAGWIMWWDMGDDSRFHVKFFIAMSVYIALTVAWCIKKGVRNVTYTACALAVLLTAIGKFIADVTFFTQWYAKLENVAADLSLVAGVAANYLPMKWEFNGFVFACDIAIVLAAGLFCWGMRPKFAVTYRSVPMPANAVSSAPAGVIGMAVDPNALEKPASDLVMK